MPIAPPIALKVTASIKNCTRRPRRARANGHADADSRVRSVTLTSMMFMMPMPPTTGDTAATPASRKPSARGGGDRLHDRTSCAPQPCSLLLCRGSSRSVISVALTDDFVVFGLHQNGIKNVRVVMRCG